MAPAVPFALLGVVQLLAVAGWVGLAGASLFPRLRRRVSVVFVIGALALAAADVLTAVRFGTSASTDIGWLRVGGLVLVALGAAGGTGQSLVLPLPATAGVVVPLGAPRLPSYVAGVVGLVAAFGAWRRGLRPGADRLFGTSLAVGLALTGVAAALADPARTGSSAALAELAARAAATAAIAVALVQIARTVLLGKLAGAILSGVVAMAAGAVGVVGTGVADEVQSQQAQRLLSVAHAEQGTLNNSLGARAALFAQVVALCPGKVASCVNFLHYFSEQNYFAVTVVPPTGTREVATNQKSLLSDAALVQLAGSSAVRDAMQPGTAVTSPSGGAVVLPGNPDMFAVFEAVPGRPNGSTDARIKPTFAAIYGIFVDDRYLRLISGETGGYDLSVVADGRVVASSLNGAQRDLVGQVAAQSRIEQSDVGVNRVVPAAGNVPTVAFVPVVAADNGDVRLATLAVSQSADDSLRAQRSVLQRMFLTALIALLLVLMLALLLARRIAEPVRRLTVAAGRVRRGDLEATTSVTSRDEVGALARAFEAMTSSLRQATGELRSAAEQEAALRARLETVVESMSDGLVVTDGRGRITSVNATAARLAGIDADAVVGRPVADVVVVVDEDGRSLLAAPPDRRTVDGRLTSSEGRTVPVRYSAAPLGDRQGRVIIIADRTREDEVERMKTEFLANVSHELRTPLTPIRGYAELLSRRPELNRDQVETFLSEILDSTARMSRAVELLVDVAALEGGRIASDVGKASVRSLVEDRIRVWKERYPERAGDFKRRTATRLPGVAVDVRWVNRALDELADNAVKYTAAGTPITLAAGLDTGEERVTISVRDAGPGFDPSVAAELVGDFSQADASETRRVGGMGLGLGFVNRVAERFGLLLTVEAQPGQGATFSLHLPVWSDE